MSVRFVGHAVVAFLCVLAVPVGVAAQEELRVILGRDIQHPTVRE
ncbi:MAG TPA: hypothetical protein VMK12_26680 [Anaeromyxobacteraceae bacterium]|nr:hypothetical protein [Anaeromyxobacteraceae bacterium]